MLRILANQAARRRPTTASASTSTSSSTSTSRTTAAARRFFASDMPTPRSQHTTFLGEHAGAGKEGWETTIYTTYTATAIVLCVWAFLLPDTDIDTWAMREAQARLDMAANGTGQKPEFGQHYAVPEKMYDFDSESPDNPFNEEDDDDDEDEDDEDEDEEEEEGVGDDDGDDDDE